MIARPIAAAALLASSTLGCLGTGTLQKPDSALSTQPTSQAKCGVSASHSEPLVTEWPASQKSRLEVSLRQGAVAVEYVGCDMRVVDACEVKGSYAFQRTTLAKDQVEIGDEDELYAKLPLGAASLSGELERSGRIAVQTVVTGQLRLAGATAADVPAEGACSRATHIITAVSVGAFKLLSGGRTKVSAGGDAMGVEAGGSTSREEEIVRESGDPSACETTGDEPNASCNSPLQIFLEPLPRHAETSAMADREGQADAPPVAGSWRVDYEAESTDQRWALVSAEGRLLCDLPCTRWTPPKSGFKLKLDAEDPSDGVEWPVPTELGYSEGRHIAITPHLDREGSNTAGPWLTIPGGLIALAGGAVFAIGLGANSGDPDGSTNRAIGGAALGVGLATAGLGIYLWSRPSGLSTRLAQSDAPDLLVGPGYARITIPRGFAVIAPGSITGQF